MEGKRWMEMRKYSFVSLMNFITIHSLPSFFFFLDILNLKEQLRHLDMLDFSQ